MPDICEKVVQLIRHLGSCDNFMRGRWGMTSVKCQSIKWVIPISKTSKASEKKSRQNCILLEFHVDIKK